MNKVETIETQVERLTREELAAFRKWFRDFDNQAWDRQIEEDARSGKLDALAAKSRAEHLRGESREL